MNLFIFIGLSGLLVTLMLTIVTVTWLLGVW